MCKVKNDFPCVIEVKTKMLDFLLADEIASRIERNIGERHARGMIRAIQDGRVKRGAVQYFGQTIAIKNTDSPRQNQVFCFAHKDLNLLPEILAFYHTALLHKRLYVASELGCTLIESGATYGSTSFRNQLRAGLLIAYIESEWKKL